MKILKIIGIVIVIIIAAIAIWFMTLPSEAHIERSISVNKSPDVVYNNIINIKNFNNWSPWVEKDPNTVYQFEGPESGVGARQNWSSEVEEVGNGAMWVTEVSENERITMRMEFEAFDLEPYASYILEGDGEGTKVTWTYDVANLGGVMKFMGMSMDSFLGPDYEKGLSNFKTYIESLPDPEPVVEEVVESDSTMTEEIPVVEEVTE